MGKTWKNFATSVIIGLFLFSAFAEPVEAVGLTATATLDEGPFDLGLEEDESGTVVIPGEVEVSSVVGGYQTVVRLEAHSIIGDASVTPSTLVFTGAGKQIVTVTVEYNATEITYSSTPYQRIDTVTLDGTAQEAVGAPTDVYPGQALVSVTILNVEQKDVRNNGSDNETDEGEGDRDIPFLGASLSLSIMALAALFCSLHDKRKKKGEKNII